MGAALTTGKEVKWDKWPIRLRSGKAAPCPTSSCGPPSCNLPPPPLSPAPRVSTVAPPVSPRIASPAPPLTSDPNRGRDVVLGVHALHSLQQPVSHRDIKAENVLLGDDGHFK